MEDVAPPFFVNGRAELAPTFQWGSRIGTPPPNLAYPAFLNTNPTQDVSVSLTKILGRHTMKAGFYSNHSLKQQNLNQRNALPFQGDLSFANDTNNPFDTGFGFANAALGVVYGIHPAVLVRRRQVHLQPDRGLRAGQLEGRTTG